MDQLPVADERTVSGLTDTAHYDGYTNRMKVDQDSSLYLWRFGVIWMGRKNAWLASTVTDAAPGVILIIVGVVIAWITRYDFKIQKNREGYST